MTINELLAAAGLNGTDELPIWNGATQKVTAQQLANAVKTLANLQGELTFDNTPTVGSTNPVTSDGINTAIAQSTAAETLFNAPKYMASGTDLDTLTTAGVYACEGAGIASTLINCPITNNNFSLLVLRSSTGRLKQVIFALDTIYTRYNAANGWNDWVPHGSTATIDLTKPITGILNSDNGGLGTDINGAIKLIRPTLANDLDNCFTEQPNVSIRLIPSGAYNGSVVGPAGETGSPSWFVISYKYSSTVGSQWGYYPAGTNKGIYVRSNNNGWGAWSKLV